jgi:hypothetical protein
MHDLVAHLDRRAILHQRALDELDRAHHACAKAARLGQKHFDRTFVNQVASHSSV